MKELHITSSKIVVSANNLCKSGYSVSHNVKGILPGCRKVAILFVSTSTGCVWVKKLYSHNGEAHIHPDHWAQLIKATPVVSSTLRNFEVTLTPAIIADAYNYVTSITVEPAIRSQEKSPNYIPKLDPMVVVGDSNGK